MQMRNASEGLQSMHGFPCINVHNAFEGPQSVHGFPRMTVHYSCVFCIREAKTPRIVRLAKRRLYCNLRF